MRLEVDTVADAGVAFPACRLPLVACFIFAPCLFGVAGQTAAYKIKDLPALVSRAEPAVFAEVWDPPAGGWAGYEPLLSNPDRGLRMEAYITLGEPPMAFPEDPSDPYAVLRGLAKRFAPEKPTVVQLYVYLSRYNERELDETAFRQLEDMLRLCKELNLRALLRFAYQTDSVPDPQWTWLDKHLTQLDAWFKRNGPLVHETLYCMQAGIIGKWGEGHSGKNISAQQHAGEIWERVLLMTPEDIFVQFRTAELWGKAGAGHAPRLGMHDDWICGEPNGAWSFFLGDPNPAPVWSNRFARTINDAEMPWGRERYYGRADGRLMNSIDAAGALRQMWQYRLTTFSLEHNYREGGMVDGKDTMPHSMLRWRGQDITAATLKDMGLPYLPTLFVDGKMTVFDYIAYHLGYLLSIRSVEAGGGKLAFTLQNNGFAAPLNCNCLSVVINGTEYKVAAYDKFALTSQAAVKYTVDLPAGAGAGGCVIGVKLATREGSPISVRFANCPADMPFADGVQRIR